MIRLTLRQFRAPAWTASIGLLVVAAMVLTTRPHLVEAAAAARQSCGTGPQCPGLAAFVVENVGPITIVGLIVTLAPALVGAFWGAPMIAREFEAGTHRLVWAQSISTGRWLAVKLAVIGAATVLATALLSALITWWAEPLDQAEAAVYGRFGQRDLVPVGYALFAFAFGVTAGLIARRTLPAIAWTLTGLLTFRILVTEWVRPIMIAPRMLSLPLDPDRTGYGSGGNILFGVGPSVLDPEPPNLPNAWIQSIHVVDSAGAALPDRVLLATCPELGHQGTGPAGPVSEPVRQQMHDCVSRIGETYHQVVTYQPGERYWTFQWLELGLFTLFAVLLGGFAHYYLRRFRE